MSQEDLEVVRDMCEATNERDFPRAMAHYAESVEMVITDDIRAGTFKGRDAVGEWFGDWFATFDRGARFEIEEITELARRPHPAHRPSITRAVGQAARR